MQIARGVGGVGAGGGGGGGGLYKTCAICVYPFLFSGKNKKHISKCHLLNFLPSMLSVNIKFMCSVSQTHFKLKNHHCVG